MKVALALIAAFVLLFCIAFIAGNSVLPLLGFEASARSPYSRASNDMRALATALGAYYTDHGAYPPHTSAGSENSVFRHFGSKWPDEFSTLSSFAMISEKRLLPLTTPLAYMVSLPMDHSLSQAVPFAYYVVDKPNFNAFVLWSSGPDGKYDLSEVLIEEIILESDTIQDLWEKLQIYSYDPTNGAISDGDLWRISW